MEPIRHGAWPPRELVGVATVFGGVVNGTADALGAGWGLVEATPVGEL